MTMYPDGATTRAFRPDTVEYILKLVESIRPEEITHPEQLLMVGPYAFAQVRIAIAQQASTHFSGSDRVTQAIDKEMYFPAIRILTKDLAWQTPFDEVTHAQLIVVYGRKGVNFPSKITLLAKRGNWTLMEFAFPILEPLEIEQHFIRLDDNRTKPATHVSLYTIGKGSSLPQLQQMWSGLRWLCRNVRLWNQPGITWPEEIEGVQP